VGDQKTRYSTLMTRSNAPRFRATKALKRKGLFDIAAVEADRRSERTDSTPLGRNCEDRREEEGSVAE